MKKYQSTAKENIHDSKAYVEVLVAGLEDQFVKTQKKVEFRNRMRRITENDRNRVFNFRR